MQVEKYSANGNDFIVFHADEKKERSGLAKIICDRHEGVGADGLIVILPSKEYDFEWQFYNSDGSEASMCGNGSRACALYAFNNKLANEQMRFLTEAGVINAHVDKNMVEVELTTPKKIREPFEDMGFVWHHYNTGVEHLVTIVNDINKFDFAIARKMRYNYNSNVNFITILEHNVLLVRTYERGVEEETLACGTGMAASFCAALDLKKVDHFVKVIPKSRDELFLRYENGGIFFKGEVRYTFKADLSKELSEVFS
ncbi:MAG: diaminopimelate epimerase [Campylobacteraceae bacterium]|jgi:diaminopimelate epimerase|nr:diaminopimelate epimerase [Campylobacteraceae bacterium]